MAIVRKRLGEILLEANMITDDQLRFALEEQRRTKESIGRTLVRCGFVTEDNIKDALELQFGINYVNFKNIKITPEVLELIPEKIIRQHQLIPISLQNNRMTIAMVDPTNLPAIDDVRVRLKGVSVNAVVITEDDFYQFLETYFKTEDKGESAVDIVGEMVELMGPQENEDLNDTELEKASEDAPIIRLANTLLVNAIKKKASDIHIEPQEFEIVVRYRIDGVLGREASLPRKIISALVSRYKIMANLDISEKRLPQDGRIRIRFGGKDIDFRVSSLPSKHGEKIVMRILDKSNMTLGLEKLFIFPEMLEQVRNMASRPYGIIFVTGPTGSGKTTTLYSILNERNTEDVNISTAEDPIEYDLGGITQCQARPEIGLTFARILKAFLRQDPDIMLIGETRDKELAKIAIESALTGHLVFTSLHTNDAPGSIMRLQEMGVEGFLIASATIGIIAQRLMRRLCPKCKEKYTPDEKTLDFVGYNYKPGQVVEFYRPKGCEECSNGYKGRMGVYEIMQINDELRDLINREANKAMIRFAAKQGGMVPLKDYSLRLVEEGHTSLDEVIRVTLTDEGSEMVCPSCRNPIGEEFIKCPFCQHELKKLCTNCRRVVEESWHSCPTCGTALEHKPKDPAAVSLNGLGADDGDPFATEYPVIDERPAEMGPACPSCFAEMDPEWDTCPYCLAVLKS